MATQDTQSAASRPIQPKQVVLVLSVVLCITLPGMATGWNAVVPKLQQDSSRFNVTDEDVSWIVSMIPVVGMVVSPWSGLLVERVGPTKLLILFFYPTIILWLIMAFAPYLWLLYLGCVGIAISCNFTNILVQPLVAELCPPRIRGLMASCTEIAFSSGLLAAFTLARVAPWHVATASLSPLLLPVSVLLYFVPESPYWLVRRGRSQEAKESLRRLVTREDAAAEELSAILSSRTGTQKSLTDQFKELRKSHNARPVLLVLSIFVLRELGGNGAVFSYSVYIFRFAGVTLDAFTCTVLVGVVRVVCSVISAFLMDRVGRRTILIPAAGTCAVAEGVCGLFLHLQTSGSSWVPLAAMLVYVASFGLGVGPVPWMFLGELLPTPVRSLGVALVSFFFHVTYFGVNYAFFKIIDSVGLGMTMVIFASANFIIAAIVWRWIPESAGKSLTEMEEAFSSLGAKSKQSGDVLSDKTVQSSLQQDNNKSSEFSAVDEETDVELQFCSLKQGTEERNCQD